MLRAVGSSLSRDIKEVRAHVISGEWMIRLPTMGPANPRALRNLCAWWLVNKKKANVVGTE